MSNEDFEYFQSFLFAVSGEALTQRLRGKIFRTLLRQEVAYFDRPENNTGALCTRLATEASDVQGVRIAFSSSNTIRFYSGYWHSNWNNVTKYLQFRCWNYYSIRLWLVINLINISFYTIYDYRGIFTNIFTYWICE